MSTSFPTIFYCNSRTFDTELYISFTNGSWYVNSCFVSFLIYIFYNIFFLWYLTCSCILNDKISQSCDSFLSICYKELYRKMFKVKYILLYTSINLLCGCCIIMEKIKVKTVLVSVYQKYGANYPLVEFERVPNSCKKYQLSQPQRSFSNL